MFAAPPHTLILRASARAITTATTPTAAAAARAAAARLRVPLVGSRGFGSSRVGAATAARITRSRREIGTRTCVRWYSESKDSKEATSTATETGSKIWSFEEIKNLATSPSSTPHITLIDVREPGELAQTGRIPGALNIPITSSPDAFHVPADEFEDRHGFARPPPDVELVFYCKAGVRSRAAAGLARDAGWTSTGEYPGSWMDWSARGGKVER
ncbi:Rhodanese-like domain-containing protein [Whalleya microplaca]|nr:Rhodanese-like domain-containing protein [Whalleya microplaca]